LTNRLSSSIINYREVLKKTLPKKRERRTFRQEARRSLTLPHKEDNLSLSPSVASGKPIMPIRYRPSPQEGQCIRYRLRLAGKKLVDVSRKFELHDTITGKIIYGKRRSARIESEIARILGKASWNDVVLEARSEVQKKPVKVILQEMEEKKQVASKTSRGRMADYIKRDAASSNTRRGA